MIIGDWNFCGKTFAFKVGRNFRDILWKDYNFNENLTRSRTIIFMKFFIITFPSIHHVSQVKVTTQIINNFNQKVTQNQIFTIHLTGFPFGFSQTPTI